MEDVPDRKVDEDLKKLDDAIMWSRNKPLTEEELKAFGPEKKAEPKVLPYIDILEVHEKGKRHSLFVPIFGVKVKF